MASEPTVLDTVEDTSVTDPLSEVTRKERKVLLAACIVGLAISAGGLVPEEIEAFGITVDPQQEESLLYILAGVLAYFLVAFAIYAWADLKRRETVAAKQRHRLRPLIQSAVAAYRGTQEKLKAKDSAALSQALRDSEFTELAGMSEDMKFAQGVQRVGAIRIFIDIYFPMVAAVTSIVVVWSSTGGFPGWRQVGWGALASSFLIGALLLWWRRRELRRWWWKKLRDKRSKRQKQLMSEIQALPMDDPRREKLAEEARDLLRKAVEDLRRGVY